jgi:ABC-type Fe3+ transport system permease subunit
MSRLPRAEYVLPIVVALAAILLAVSEFLVAFDFTAPGDEVEAQQTAGDRHGYANLLLAGGAVVAMVIALATGARAAAFAVAGLGAVTLLLFLVFDLPDAGRVGELEDFITAKAEPRAGFWLEAIGALTLGLAGGAFATLSSGQLLAAGRRLRRRPAEPATTAENADQGRGAKTVGRRG